MARETREIYEFGSYRLDVDEHTLERVDGTKNGSLPDKAFHALTILVRNRGRLVTKRELIDEIWPDAFVEENNLDKCIHAIRHALGERRGEQAFIETVRKHGYRFVADVAQTPPTNGRGMARASSASDPLEEKPLAARNPREILARSAAYVLIALGVLASAFFYLYRATPASPQRSIAVLPFAPIESGARDDIYELGMADSLIHKLTSSKGMLVRPLSATRKYTGEANDPISAGRAEKVEFVIASNYQIVDERMRVISQLINVESGQIEETVRSEASVGNKFTLQDAIAHDIANFVFARLGRTPIGIPERRGTESEDAYRLLLTGLDLTDQRNPGDARKAQGYFQQAIDLDPRFARAYAGFARAIIAGSNLGGGVPREESQRARSAIDTALSLDPDLAVAHSALAELKFVYDWEFDAAEADVRRALELDPQDASAHGLYGAMLAARGSFDSALTEVGTALELDPNSLALQRDRGRILYLARRYDEAIDQLKKVLDRNPNYATAQGWLALSLEQKGNDREAFEWLTKQRTPEEKARLQTLFDQSGMRGISQDFYEDQKGNIDTPAANFYRLARLAVKLGDHDSAFRHLESAIQYRNAQMVMLMVEPAFDPIRDDPRYTDVLRQIGL